MIRTDAGPGPPRVPILLLMGICLVCQSAVVMHLPALSTLQTTFGASQAAVQATLSVFLATFACTQLIVGPLSDRYGRRRVLIAGLVLFVSGSALCAAAPSIGWLIGARVLQGAGACTGVVMSRAIVRDLADGPAAARAIAMLASALATAPALGPLVGGQLLYWFSWPAIFVFATLCACTIFGFSVRLLPQTGGGSRRGFFDGYGELLRNRRFLGYLGGISCGTATFYSFVGAASPLLVDVLHLPVQYFGLIPLTWAGAFVVGAQIVARLGPRIGPRRMIFFGAVMSLLAALAMTVLALAQVHSIMAVAIPLLFVGLGNGLNIPNGSALALGAAPARIAGASSAAIGFSQIGLGSIVTWIMGFVPQESALPMGLAISGFCLVALASYLLALRAPPSVAP